MAFCSSNGFLVLMIYDEIRETLREQFEACGGNDNDGNSTSERNRISNPDMNLELAQVLCCWTELVTTICASTSDRLSVGIFQTVPHGPESEGERGGSFVT